MIFFAMGVYRKELIKMQNQKKQQEQQDKDNSGWIICKEYTNRWGQRMIASDYGYQFWRFPAKRR